MTHSFSVDSDSPEVRRRKYRRTQPQCRLCWQKEHPDKKCGELLSGSAERCVTCGGWFRVIVWIEIDPVEAPYPSLLNVPDGRGLDREAY